MQEMAVYAGRMADLFDSHDPAPIGQKKIDPSIVEYVLGELSGASRDPVSLVIFLDDAGREVEGSVRGGFAATERHIRKEAQEVMRNGFALLPIAAVALGILLVLTVPTYLIWGDDPPLYIQAFFIIIGWVIIWRPCDVILFDWWAVGTKRRRLAHIRKGSITVKRAP